MRRGLAILTCLAFALSSQVAFADATSCSKDAEEGQRARANGRLRDARERFLACSATECPGVVQKDCTTWASEVLLSIPTIVVDAKDASGADIADVIVSLDDKVVAQRIDGKAIAIDLGPHTLRFEHRGFAPVTQQIIAKEGVKARVVTVSFVERTGPPAPRRGLVSSTPTGSGGHTVYPWLIVGGGVIAVAIGAVLIATAPSLPAGCTKGTETCANLPTDRQQDDPKTVVNENPDLAERQKEAGRSDAQPITGAITMAVGGFVIVGGLLWHFLEPGESPGTSTKVRPKLTPWMARDAGGMAFFTAF